MLETFRNVICNLVYNGDIDKFFSKKVKMGTYCSRGIMLCWFCLFLCKPLFCNSKEIMTVISCFFSIFSVITFITICKIVTEYIKVKSLSPITCFGKKLSTKFMANSFIKWKSIRANQNFRKFALLSVVNWILSLAMSFHIGIYKNPIKVILNLSQMLGVI